MCLFDQLLKPPESKAPPAVYGGTNFVNNSYHNNNESDRTKAVLNYFKENMLLLIFLVACPLCVIGQTPSLPRCIIDS